MLFATLLVISASGPVLTAMKLHDSASVPLDEGQLRTVILLSCAALLIAPFCAFEFAD